MIEETVVQSESNPVVEQKSATPEPPVNAVKKQYEDQITQLQKKLSDNDNQWSEKFNDLKGKLDNMDKEKKDARKKSLEDQGQWKTLWEEANKTAQEKDQKITTLAQQIEEMKTSSEVASTRTKALAAISNLGAINAEQTLSLLQGKLQKNSEGNVVVLNGGVEQDLGTYLTSLKNPGSGWEHHFKPSSAAGMGAKPSPISNVSGGTDNPWKNGNLTQQLIMEGENPDLAAVLKREAQS